MRPPTLAALAALGGLAAGIGMLVLTVANGGDVVFSIVTTLAIFPYAAVGFLVASRRPRSPIGWLVLALPLFFESAVLFGQYALFAGRNGTPLGAVALWLSFWLWVPGWLALGLVFLLFPDGHLPSPRWRPVLWAIVVATALAALASAVSNDPRGTQIGLANPLAVNVPFSLYEAGIALLLVVFVVPAISLVARYGRADGRVRRKLKWLAYGSGILVLASVAYLVLLRSTDDASATDVGDFIFIAGIAAPAFAIGVAILRDRVFDIDVLINRTLVYAGVSAVLVATYAAAVVSLQALMRPLTGGSDLAVAVSTLIVVALFQPIRRAVQDAVDRRFYRSRYDAARTLDAFSARLRNEVDIEAVRAAVVDVVARTVAPAHAELWLRVRDTGR